MLPKVFSLNTWVVVLLWSPGCLVETQGHCLLCLSQDQGMQGAGLAPGQLPAWRQQPGQEGQDCRQGSWPRQGSSPKGCATVPARQAPLRLPSRTRSQTSGGLDWVALKQMQDWHAFRQVGGGGLMPLMTTNESLQTGEGVFNTWNEKFGFAQNWVRLWI